jgi:hypothetical protein
VAPPGIVQQKNRTVRTARYLDRSNGPRGVQLFSQRIFVLQAFQTLRRRVLGDWQKHESLRRIVLTPAAIKNKLLILPQRLEGIP